ncbi:STAS/SEC14 domain-containing protein [Actinomycetospora rhizophila]|uniref:STAS/SEC14 domain-containing protein n=1 Tax=Actinomycetospora rhizophila TaxID=1416876 RepID=A0ABV9ZBB7_9PSEU
MLEYEGEALAEELMFAVRHVGSYERVAVVSDHDGLRPALRVLSAPVSGQWRAFPLDRLPQATAWVATGQES